MTGFEISRAPFVFSRIIIFRQVLYPIIKNQISFPVKICQQTSLIILALLLKIRAGQVNKKVFFARKINVIRINGICMKIVPSDTVPSVVFMRSWRKTLFLSPPFISIKSSLGFTSKVSPQRSWWKTPLLSPPFIHDNFLHKIFKWIITNYTIATFVT